MSSPKKDKFVGNGYQFIHPSSTRMMLINFNENSICSTDMMSEPQLHEYTNILNDSYLMQCKWEAANNLFDCTWFCQNICSPELYLL